jgi:septal ring factor EnvC (AmiA/AmiB activator)
MRRVNTHVATLGAGAYINKAARAARLEDLRAHAAAAQELVESLGKRAENLKMDLGDLANMAARYASKQDEVRSVRARLKEVQENIEQIMATQGGGSYSDIRWQTMPEK